MAGRRPTCTRTRRQWQQLDTGMADGEEMTLTGIALDREATGRRRVESRDAAPDCADG